MTPLERAQRIVPVLKEAYPDTRPLLDYATPFQLLVAVILSAQTTDAQVNRVTPELFRRFPDADALADAPQAEVEELVKSTGFYRNKAKNIREAARVLREEFDARVPATIEELTRLPGVGRKTANAVAGVLYGEPAIIVDTHFRRVVLRVGLTDDENPDKIERQMRRLIPESHQTHVSMALTRHGRYVCQARKPRCYDCPIETWCAYEKKRLE
jgi:endonuclease-3